MMDSGVYIIRNTINGKVYVGSSKSFAERFKAHIYELQKNTHHSNKLQSAWNKYGEDAFVFEKVLICSVDQLLFYEQIVLDYYKAADNGYNILRKAGSREGTPHSKEVLHCMKLSQRARRKKYDFDGQQLCATEISEKTGIPRDVLWRRIVAEKLSLSEAVSKPYKKPGQKLPGLGTELTFYEWIDRLGCTENFLRIWLAKGLTIDECVEKHKRITVYEFARVSGVDSNMFAARMRLGWSVGDALATPVRKTLTLEDARSIRSFEHSKTKSQLATEYGVHIDTIELILKNKSFKEIDFV